MKKMHPILRIVLMSLCGILGLAMVLTGWSMTGQLNGLLMMLTGILLMLTALFLYNKAYQ
jgi:hypothetical protein